MATYYVRKTGSDAAAGTTAGTAWLTIQKALDTIASGDNVFVGAGEYTEDLSVATASLASQVVFTGDFDGTNTGDSGIVNITGNHELGAASNINNYAWENFEFYSGGGASDIWKMKWSSTGANPVAGTTQANNWRWENCSFYCDDNEWGISLHDTTLNSSVFANAIIRDCFFYNRSTASGGALGFDTNSGNERLGGDITFEGNIVIGGWTTLFLRSPGGSVAGTLTVRRNIFIGAGSSAISYNAAVGVATAVIENNIIFKAHQAGIAISCSVITCVNNTIMYCNEGISYSDNDSLNQIYKNNNIFFNGIGLQSTLITLPVGADRDYNNVYKNRTADYSQWGTGANDISIHPKPVESSFIASKIASFGKMFGYPESETVGVVDGGIDTTGSASVDFSGLPRPQGIGVDIGAYEVNPEPVKESTVFNNAAPSMRFDGKSFFDFKTPVEASTTASVKVQARWTGSGTVKPQIFVLNNSDLGITTASDQVTGGADTWEQLSVTVVPEHDGVIKVRVQSNDFGASDIAYFDDFEIVT